MKDEEQGSEKEGVYKWYSTDFDERCDDIFRNFLDGTILRPRKIVKDEEQGSEKEGVYK